MERPENLVVFQPATLPSPFETHRCSSSFEVALIITMLGAGEQLPARRVQPQVHRVKGRRDEIIAIECVSFR
jgi:hypothetical protein